MITRKEFLKYFSENVDSASAIVSCLGRVSRDLYHITGTMRERCFYNLGAMGSVIPLAIGISIVKENTTVYAIEGDGSLLMNLGTLVTVKRYAKKNLKLIIIDNGVYESTGGQPSQPEGLELESLVNSLGLLVSTVATMEECSAVFAKKENYDVLVVKCKTAIPSPRIPDTAEQISTRFKKWLNQ